MVEGHATVKDIAVSVCVCGSRPHRSWEVVQDNNKYNIVIIMTRVT